MPEPKTAPDPSESVNAQANGSPLKEAVPARGADVFVSYCHLDMDWRNWLLSERPQVERIRFWSDAQIHPSADWNQEIKSSLESAKVAVLLVSRNFLKSKFILENELPVILQRRQTEQAKILWVPLDIGEKDLQNTPLSGIQGAWPLNRPLKKLRGEPAKDAARNQICDEILHALDPDLFKVCKVLDKQAEKYEVIRLMGRGISRSMYLGRDPALERDVSIVTLRSREDQDKENFKESLRRACEVEHIECFTKIYKAGVSTDPPFCVRQYIKGQTLQEWLRHGRISPRLARDILLRLGNALKAAHQRDFYHLNIKPSNIYVDQWDSVFLSALSRKAHYFEWMKENWGGRGDDHPTDEDRAYAVPEFILGGVVAREAFAKSDQYLLGLLGYHMITGTLPKRVDHDKVPQSKSDFLDLAPIQSFCKLCPLPLSEAIMRMASRSPSDRFNSLTDALQQLKQFGNEAVVLARESYRRVAARKDWESEVFTHFYDQFRSQSKSEKAKEMFEKMNWPQQHEMLKEAVLLLLVFCEVDASDPREPTVLSRIATRHSKLDLAPGDLDLFQSLLIDSFVQFDLDCQNNPDLREDIRQAWKEALQPGIQFMKNHVPR